eukprot:6574797-Lingulodinium_polyedra.AAC.1
MATHWSLLSRAGVQSEPSRWRAGWWGGATTSRRTEPSSAADNDDVELLSVFRGLCTNKEYLGPTHLLPRVIGQQLANLLPRGG